MNSPVRLDFKQILARVFAHVLHIRFAKPTKIYSRVFKSKPRLFKFKEKQMNYLFIINTQPYNGTDVVYNALRLAGALHKKGESVRIFLMNDAVDLARDCTQKPQNYDIDLVAMLRELYNAGVALKVCGGCMTRCGVNVNQPYFNDEVKGSMEILSNWVIECDKALTF